MAIQADPKLPNHDHNKYKVTYGTISFEKNNYLSDKQKPYIKASMRG